MYLKGSLLILFLAATGAHAPIATSQQATDRAELSRLEKVWNEAHLRGDADALDRLWGEGLVITVPKMPLMTKAEAIGVWRSARMRFQRYETSHVRIDLYGDAAVVTGQVNRSRKMNGRDVEDTWRFTKVYVRRTGGWQVVAWHASAAAQ